MKILFRALLIASLCSAFHGAPASAQKTKAQLTTEVSTTFPDNTVGSITPFSVRAFQNDVLNSIMPTAPVTSGNLVCFDGITGLLKDCTYIPNNIIIGTTSIASGISKGLLYNNAGVLANTNAVPGAMLVTDGSSNPTLSANPGLGIPGSTIGSISFANATSGTVAIQPTTGALGTAVATLPAGNYSIVGDSISQTLTNKSISGASNTLVVRLASDVTGTLPFANLPTGTQDTILGYWGSTTISAIAVSNCTGALTYSTATHTLGCNSTTAGNVSNTGVPVANQIAQWTNATTVQGVSFASLLTAMVTQNTTVANPAGTASVAGVMMGLGATCKITPAVTGRVRFTISGSMANNNATHASTVGGRYGSGAAPANAAATTGTAFLSNSLVGLSSSNGQTLPFTADGLVTGLSVGTQYWYDANLAADSGATTSSITSLSCIAQEF